MNVDVADDDRASEVGDEILHEADACIRKDGGEGKLIPNDGFIWVSEGFVFLLEEGLSFSFWKDALDLEPEVIYVMDDVFFQKAIVSALENSLVDDVEGVFKFGGVGCVH